MKIYLTAIIESQPEFLEEVKAVLQNMVIQTQKETASLQYDLHQGIEDENKFIFYEIWENQSGLDEHNKQPYIQDFIKLFPKLTNPPTIIVSHKL